MPNHVMLQENEALIQKCVFTAQALKVSELGYCKLQASFAASQLVSYNCKTIICRLEHV